MANPPEKTTPAAVPGVPAAKANSQPVATPSPAPVAKANATPPPALPAGDVTASQREVARLNGLKGGRPRKDGLVPGSAEADAADKEKARARMARLRGERQTILSTVAPLPAATTPEPGTSPSGATSTQTIAVDFAGQPPLAPLGWTPTDLQPVVENTLAVGEEWDYADNKKIIAPLELDAAAQSRVLQPTRWPQAAKTGLMQGGAQSLAQLFNAIGVPVGVKNHLLAIPAAARLWDHITASKKELRLLVAEEMRKKKGEAAAAEVTKKTE